MQKVRKRDKELEEVKKEGKELWSVEMNLQY